MSGTPTEAEIRTQLTNAIDLLETTRVHADDVVVGGGGLIDVLTTSVEGDYTPTGLVNAAEGFRAGLSSLMSPGSISAFLDPILLEYGKFLGSNYSDTGNLMRVLYEHFADGPITVQSRNITFDTSVTAGGSNVGDGTLTRLTEDENGYDLEACNVEAKTLRCRTDQNNGAREHAEIFELQGAAASFDDLDVTALGSGVSALIRSRHAGGGDGGSRLSNSSFSEYDATATPKFRAWNLSGTGTSANVVQDTTNYFRSHPGAGTDGSLKITADGSNTFTLKQPLSSMRVTRMDANTPYFFRVMVNKDVGSGTLGTINIRMGSQTVSQTVAGLGAGWQEIIMVADSTAWFRSFNEDPMDVEIEWVCASSTGYLLFDDAIFSAWQLIDGTYWMLRGGATPWLVDDTLTVTDTGGAPATGKIQYYFQRAGYGYLPSTTGTPTIADPT